MALTNFDILNLLEPFQQYGIFKGVFACDSLPKIFSLPAAFIVNLSKHDSRGTHWVALHIDRTGVAEYFDSFGLPPSQNDILKFIQSNCKRISFNGKQIQHITSNKCGKYVILFILCKMLGKSVREVFGKFSSNLSVNDIVIENLIKYFLQLRINLILD